MSTKSPLQATGPQTISPAPSFSPASSASTTPSTASPTSPRSSQVLPPHPATRQIRPPKSPMYIPAALRPTERRHRARPSQPPTPPQSMHSSSESLLSRPQTPRQRPTISTQMAPVAPATAPNAGGISTTPSSPTSLVSPTMAGSGVGIGGGNFPHPTRAHWKPDADASVCDAFGCNTNFSLLNRRHHCRRCGGVFCATDSAALVPLDDRAEFDPYGGWWRACGVCEKKWLEKVKKDLVMGNEGAAGNESTATKAIGVKGGAKVSEGEVPDQAAASVPKDWNWSTF